jgi:DNA invertase Pin-like site-specific DNA recombinase
LEAAANDAWVKTNGGETQDRRYVAYYRVSTRKQGRSGLGLEAQRASVCGFLKSVSGTLFGEFTEVESGTRKDRPQFNEALRLCRVFDATLVIAKLDRLARNVALTAKLMEGEVEFVAADFPQANRLTIHLLAAIAEYEAKLISERMKAAIKAVQARGRSWGGYRNAKTAHLADARLKANEGRIRRAKARAIDLAPLAGQMREKGMSLKRMCVELDRLGIRTRQNRGKWYIGAVRKIFLLSAGVVPRRKKRSVYSRRFDGASTSGAIAAFTNP